MVYNGLVTSDGFEYSEESEKGVNFIEEKRTEISTKHCEVLNRNDLYEENHRCGCGLLVHLSDIGLHAIYCPAFHPFIRIARLSRSLLYQLGIDVPRSPISLRIRKNSFGFWKYSDFETNFSSDSEMSDVEAGEQQESATEPAEMEQEGAESDDGAGDPGATLSFEETKPELPPPGENSNEETNDENGIASPDPPDEPLNDSVNKGEENGIATPDRSDAESNDTQEQKSPPARPEPAKETAGKEEPAAQTGGIRMRAIVDLLKNGVTEEKPPAEEEPFAALNDLVNNINASERQMKEVLPPSQSCQIMSPSSQPQPQFQQQNFNANPQIPSSVQISVRKRPAPNLPSCISVVKQPRRDSDSSGSSSTCVSPAPQADATPAPKLPEGITLVRAAKSPQQPPDSVANMLATRGVSVTPSKPPPVDLGSAVSIKKTPARQVPLPLNSALTITAAQPRRSRPTMATVDLTDDTAPPPVAARPIVRPVRFRTNHTCDICDKAFANETDLRMHMTCHSRGVGRGGMMGRPPIRGAHMNHQQPPPAMQSSSPSRMPSQGFRCKMCAASYPSQQSLNQHVQRFHPEIMGGSIGNEVVIPIVDLNNRRTREALSSAGVRLCVPLCGLTGSNGSGNFVLPLLPVDQADNPAYCNIDTLNPSNVIPLGRLAPVSKYFS